jgi:hypothetical protein
LTAVGDDDVQREFFPVLHRRDKVVDSLVHKKELLFVVLFVFLEELTEALAFQIRAHDGRLLKSGLDRIDLALELLERLDDRFRPVFTGHSNAHFDHERRATLTVLWASQQLIVAVEVSLDVLGNRWSVRIRLRRSFL